MSTAKRRRGQSLHLDLSGGSSEELPALAAVFLVLFDTKAGYTIAWKRSIPSLELDDSVEYKSLPSGLHQVAEDLVYFIHGDSYAGISAFINRPAEVDRKTLMLAVGALVPISYGRLGKSWKHAEGLEELARELVQNPSDTRLLEEFWKAHQIPDDGSQDGQTSLDSPSVDKVKRKQSQLQPAGLVRSRKRAISTASALAPPASLLSSHHPALSLPTFLDTLGPLIFPIYKAALLRKRLLIVAKAPVELACNFVYDISILSGIPSSVIDLLPLDPLPTRLTALFSVGIHDISFLSSPHLEGWVACTTDDILATKSQLYDTLLTLPATYKTHANPKIWPSAKSQSGDEIKATQRDLRRYQVLRQQLHFSTSARGDPWHSPNATDASKRNSLVQEQINRSSTNFSIIEDPNKNYDDVSAAADANIVEPQSWSALAYDSFMWWASAGEKRTDLSEEEEADRALLPNLSMTTTSDVFSGRNEEAAENTSARENGDSVVPEPNTPAGKSPALQKQSPMLPGAIGSTPESLETSIIAYFHRFTERILSTLSEIVDSGDEQDGEYERYRDDEDGDENENTGLLQSQQRNPKTASPKTSQRNDEAIDDTDERETEVEDRQDLPPVEITSDDMSRMGLDLWSASDRTFIKELVDLYWGRKCVVRRGGVECCGVRIC